MNGHQVMRGAATRRRRADAERSIEAILDAAQEAVTATGDVTMAAIARSAGLSRVTLYTHFPTREALLEAAARRALARADDVLSEIPLDGRPTEALSHLLRSSWPILDRHRNLYTVVSAALPPARLRALHDPVFGRIEQLVARGQADGDFRTDLPLTWLVATIYSVLHQAAAEVNAGRLVADQAGDVVASTVLAVLTHRPDPVPYPHQLDRSPD